MNTQTITHPTLHRALPDLRRLVEQGSRVTVRWSNGEWLLKK